MKFRKSMLSASIATALLFAAAAQAQNASPQSSTDQSSPQQKQTGNGQQTNSSHPSQVQQLQTIQVVGIRASLKASLETKRNANAIVDAVTAQDIGKFAATNAAEVLAQIPGVTLDHSIPATQRVSIDGMDPSLNVTLLDGHPVAQAMWLFGDSPNRGFNYSLLPPEIVQSIEVFKSPMASLPAGSLGGTVFIHTFEPLTLSPNTFTGSIGYNFNQMVSKGKPNASVFYSWHNDAKTFGVDVSAQHYEQFGNRQGMENYGYTSVAALNTAALAAGNTAIQDELSAGKIKSTDLMPNQMSAANFQQTEKRDSVNVNLQFRPNQNFESTLSLMYMRDRLNNVNQSMYAWAALRPGGITSLTEGPNGIITAGSSVDPNPPCAGDTAGACGQKAITLADNFARGSDIKTKGIDWRTRFSGDGWRMTTQAGVSLSRNPITQYLKELAYGGSFNWDIQHGFQFTDPTTADNPNYWADYGWGGNGSQLPYKAKDTYAQTSFAFDLNGFFNELLFGARWATHWESQTELVHGGATPETLTQIGFGGLTDLNGASDLGLFPSMVSHVQTGGYDAIKNAVVNSVTFPGQPDPNSYWDNSWNMNQQNEAAFVQANFGNNSVFGNIGVRFVKTKTSSWGWNVPGSCAAADSWSCVFPDGYGLIGQTSTHNNWLPSFNIAWNVTPNLVLRGAASETIAYAPYNQLAPYFEANDTVLTATAGNPNLDPYKSYNFDGSAEWYFNSQSVLAASIFYKNVVNYVVNAANEVQRVNGSWTLPGYINSTGNAQIAAGLCTADGVCEYSVSQPVDGGHAKVKGFTLSWQQPFGDTGFGMRANYTWSDASTKSGEGLPYNSRNAVNVSPYYEKGPLTASLSYNYRSGYLAGGYVAGAAPTSVEPFTELDASVSWAFNRNFSLSLNALNLLNETYRTYLGSKTQISTEYKTGREYLASLHFKFGSAPAAPLPPATPPPPPPPVAPPPPPPPQKVVIDLRGVNFKFDRPRPGETNIGPTLMAPASASIAILSQAVDTLNRYPQVQVEIDGYTDSRGSAAYNQKLSERRANIVDQYLTGHGIDASRITAVKGFGESDPIDTNKTAAGRQRNRRVEFKVGGEGIEQGQQ